MNSRLLFLSALIGLISVSNAQSKDFTLTLLHTNDVHSRVEPAIISKREFGGFARLATLVKKSRREDKNTLLVHAGDAFQGTLYYNVYKGMADVALMNEVGYQAMTLGNHEFDDGPAGLAPFLRAAQFPVVSTNLDFTDEPLLRNFVLPSTVIIVGGQKIGIVGAMTPDLFSISSPGEGVKVKPLAASIQSEVDSLTNRGVNKIILLSHIGYEEDKALAPLLKNVDVIVGGHSHSYLGTLEIPGFPKPMGAYPTKVGETLIVTAWEWGKLLGRIQLTFDAGGKVKASSGTPIPVDETVPDDPRTAAMVAAFRKPIEQLKAQVVGNTVTGIDRNYELGPELPMGNVIADAQLAYTQKQNTVFALMNQGGVRSAIEPGPITYDEIISTQPFGNTLVVMDLTGQEVKDALAVGAGKGSFIQVSKGFKYSVKKIAEKSFEIASVSLSGAPLEMNKTYRVVLNNFMARGGDGFVSFQNAKGFRLDTGFLDTDAVIEFFKKNNPIEGKREGRITVSQ